MTTVTGTLCAARALAAGARTARRSGEGKTWFIRTDIHKTVITGPAAKGRDPVIPLSGTAALA